MPEPVFRTLEVLAKAVIAATRTKITIHGQHNVSERGGALIAMNHTSYVDWLPASLATVRRGRRLRFLIKAELQQVRADNIVIKHIKLIPVDRNAGAEAYALAVRRLREGELVGLHPEATISRSFELRDFKTGAARLAHEAKVPIIPLIVWGAHRIWTKDHPTSLGRKRIPITVNFGAPIYAGDTLEQTQGALRASMNALLHDTQESYPHPAGAYWVPRRLGGGVPTPEEATALDEAELTQRADHHKTVRKLIDLSPRRWRVSKTARLAGTGESRRQMARNATGEQPKRIA
jgi:1-acyl-sn-glycerol-3-phosphate acyltransferase